MDCEYGQTWSSRRVIKGVNGEEKAGAVHFYSEDIWEIVGKEVLPRLPKGVTVYGEIVGWTPSGEPIQPGYHYGCAPGTHKFLVYRVTTTNYDGVVYELGWPQLKNFCQNIDLEFVKEFYYGYANNFVNYKDMELDEWQQELLWTLEKYYACDEMCVFNNREVPAEGIVLRVEKLDECQAFKLKNFKFLERETKLLDNDVPDMEELQSEGE